MPTGNKFIINIKIGTEILPKSNIVISVLKCNGNSR